MNKEQFIKKNMKISKVFNYLKHEDPFAKGISFCPGCALELLLRFIPQVLGNDIIITGTPSCSAPVLLGQNLGSWHKLAYYGTLMTGAAANATGLVRYYNKADINNTVICFNGDGTAADIGLGNLSGAAQRNDPFIYICYDNEGYMNTGIQSSSTTPYGAKTTTTLKGKVTRGKNLPLIMAMHKIPYVATSSLHNLEDLAKKLLKAKEKKNEGFCFIHVYTPCPTGWGIPSNSTIELCRMATKTNYYMLWEAEDGYFKLTFENKQAKHVTEYLQMIKKFQHLTEEDIGIIQKDVDYNYSLLKNLCNLDISH